MDEVERFPAWTLVQTYHVVARGFAEVFAEVGLTPTQFGVLVQLSEDAQLTQAALARRALVRPQSMGTLIGSLLARGLVARDAPGGRGRPAGITITDEGRRVLAASWPGVRAFNAPERLGLTAEQADVLDGLLHQVLVALGGAAWQPR